MSADMDPQKYRERQEQSWDELCRRIGQATPASGSNVPLDDGVQLTKESLPPSDPKGIFEQLDAMQADGIQRWNYLVSKYPCRHYFQAEVSLEIWFKPEGAAEQQKIQDQENRVYAWLDANLKEGEDFEIEGTGVSLDFHIFFKTEEIYKRFCQETGEKETPPS